MNWCSYDVAGVGLTLYATTLTKAGSCYTEMEECRENELRSEWEGTFAELIRRNKCKVQHFRTFSREVAKCVVLERRRIIR